MEQCHYYGIHKYWQRSEYGIQTVRVVPSIKEMVGAETKQYATTICVFKVTTRTHIQCGAPVVVGNSDAYYRHSQQNRY